MNFETPELFDYKNKEGRIIVLYDEEENLAPKVAQVRSKETGREERGGGGGGGVGGRQGHGP